MKRFCLPIIWILTLASARGAEVSGIPEITDGDTVIISGAKPRLLDMDAPESDQFCLNKNSGLRTFGGSRSDTQHEPVVCCGDSMAVCLYR